VHAKPSVHMFSNDEKGCVNDELKMEWMNVRDAEDIKTTKNV